MEKTAHIRIQEDGSYIVTGGVMMTEMSIVENEEGERVDWEKGKDFPFKEKYSLCRCGHSKNKPYCDSTHKTIQFNGRLTTDREHSSTRWNTYAGQGIIMTDDESLCAGFAFCDRFGGVWSELEQPDDPETKKRIEKQIHLCPSGRLQYFTEESNRPVEKKYEPEIAVVPNGPLRVLGGISIEAPDGFIYEIRNRVLLCRCGLSNNKPFCDGSHSSGGFKSE